MHFSFFFFNDTATTEIYTLSLHDALPIYRCGGLAHSRPDFQNQGRNAAKDFSCIDGFRLKRQTILWKELFKRPLLCRSEEHTSELQSRLHLVCRLLLEKKKKQNTHNVTRI